MAKLRGSKDLELGTLAEVLKVALQFSTNEHDLRNSVKSIIKTIEAKLSKTAKPLLSKMPK